MNGTLYKLVRTDASVAATVLRLMLGVVFFAHSSQKVLGWFGGYGLAGTYGFFTHQLGIPSVVAALAIAAELLGSLGLIFGALTRIAALGVGAVMIGAIATVHGKFGFFMNWSGQQKGEGIEYHLLVLAMVTALIVLGGGCLSLDRAVSRSAK